jgi:hypothetical protein
LLQVTTLSQAYHDIDEMDLAIAACRRRLELAPEDDRFTAGVWLLHLYVDLRDVERARRQLDLTDPGGKQRSTDFQLNELAARVALLERDPKRAIAILDAVDGAFPNTDERREARASALLMLGEPAQARSLLEGRFQHPEFAQTPQMRVLKARILHALGEGGAVDQGKDACRDWLAAPIDAVGNDLSVCDQMFKPDE